MVRRVQAAPVSAGMYRHFAMITLVVTGLMAMLFNGDTREAVAREVDQAGRPDPRANPNEFIRKDMAPRASSTPSEWVDVEFGQPTDPVGAAYSGGVASGLSLDSGDGVPVGFTAFGVPAAVWASLSEEQRKKLKAEHAAAQAAASRPEREREIEALRAASRQRAGGTGGSPD